MRVWGWGRCHEILTDNVEYRRVMRIAEKQERNIHWLHSWLLEMKTDSSIIEHLFFYVQVKINWLVPKVKFIR